MARLLDGAGGVKLAQPVGVAIGVALMAAPAAFGYAGSAASDLQRVVGPTVASLALIAWWEATVAVRWPNVVLGLALVLAPLVVDHSGSATVVAVVSGLLVAAATPFAGAPSQRFAGGWKALVRTPAPGQENP